jgi:hypothetical protein
MNLECTVTKTLKADGYWQLVYLLYKGGSATRILKTNQAVASPVIRKVSVMSPIA